MFRVVGRSRYRGRFSGFRSYFAALLETQSWSTIKRVHIRSAKGGKDRYVLLPDLTLQTLRAFWKTHRHPRLLFPNPVGGRNGRPPAATSMDRGGVQAAMKAAVADCGIRRKISVHSLRHYAACGINARDLPRIAGRKRAEGALGDRAAVGNRVLLAENTGMVFSAPLLLMVCD